MMSFGFQSSCEYTGYPKNTQSRVTLIEGLPPRLTSFWIISFKFPLKFPQFSSNFLSNSPFPPSPAGRQEQSKPPCPRVSPDHPQNVTKSLHNVPKSLQIHQERPQSTPECDKIHSDHHKLTPIFPFIPLIGVCFKIFFGQTFFWYKF